MNPMDPLSLAVLRKSRRSAHMNVSKLLIFLDSLQFFKILFMKCFGHFKIFKKSTPGDVLQWLTIA